VPTRERRRGSTPCRRPPARAPGHPREPPLPRGSRGRRCCHDDPPHPGRRQAGPKLRPRPEPERDPPCQGRRETQGRRIRWPQARIRWPQARIRWPQARIRPHTTPPPPDPSRRAAFDEGAPEGPGGRACPEPLVKKREGPATAFTAGRASTGDPLGRRCGGSGRRQPGLETRSVARAGGVASGARSIKVLLSCIASKLQKFPICALTKIWEHIW
jgi:hypothetical protein